MPTWHRIIWLLRWRSWQHESIETRSAFALNCATDDKLCVVHLVCARLNVTRGIQKMSSNLDSLYLCPACNAPLPSTQGLSDCPKCKQSLRKLRADANLAGIGSTPGTSRTADDLEDETGYQPAGSAAACVLIGLLTIGLGLYFLVFPTGGGSANVANLHALAMGQTFTLAGTILFGLGIRPR